MIEEFVDGAEIGELLLGLDLWGSLQALLQIEANSGECNSRVATYLSSQTSDHLGDARELGGG